MTTYPSGFETKIGFAEIRSLLKSHCLCELGEAFVDEMAFSNRFEEVMLRMGELSEYRTLLQMEERTPLNELSDITPVLKRIRIEGTFIDVEEIVALGRVLDAIRQLLSFFQDKMAEKYPRLFELASAIAYYPFIRQRIDAMIDKFGRIRDNASPELAAIRRELASKQGVVARMMQRVLKQAQSEGWAEADTSLSIRDGRAVIPLSATYKRRIPGIVHDESASGKTSYVEPAEVVETNNQIRELALAERREIIRILTAFTVEIRPYMADLTESCRIMGNFDFIRAKALLSLKWGAVEPSAHNAQSFTWIRAVHPLMFRLLQKEGREVVPLDITLTEENHLLLISGPNAGGKSVCLKTTGLLQYMFQCGLSVPMSENSEMGFFDHIFIDIGDEQSIENDLSTYSSHLLNMKYFLRNANEKTLLLIDEFGTGTEPALGGAIAETILDHLNQQGAFGVITTHYTNLKHFAASTPGLVNGAMLYDSNRMLPLFKLQIGKPGSSFAFEIARKIGLPESVLQEASGKVGQEHIDFDKHLRDIVRDKRYWESKRNQIRLSGKQLETDLLKYQTELEQLKRERKSILESARKEAEQLLAGVNRQIENTIRTIRESQADKEKTREARRVLESEKKRIEEPIPEMVPGLADTEARIARKMEQLRQREEQKQRGEGTTPPDETPAKEALEKSRKTKIPDLPKPLTAGDKVQLEGQEFPGEIVQHKGNQCVVAFGHLLVTVPLSKLKRISKNEYKRLAGDQASKKGATSSYNPMERRLHFKPRIDVRGFTAEEAVSKVAALIDEALMLDYSEVHILHGKGNGILRQQIRAYLQSLSQVTSFRDEAEEFGGAGITVVEL
ncbi:MAG: endonuclease MutS2 [Bacteroidales bacterium]